MSEPANLEAACQSFVAHMTTAFGATLRNKEESDEMRAIGLGLDLARVLGASTPSRDHFMGHISTTLGRAIYVPPEVRANARSMLVVLTHECQHVAQLQQETIQFPWLYLREPEARTRYEVDAYAAGLAVGRWLTGRMATIDDIHGRLMRSYHLRPEDGDLARDLLRSHIASLESDVAMARAGREAIAFLDANFPHLKKHG